MRVIATCTTLPTRYDTLFRTLCCLKNQDYVLDAIYLTLPYKSKRLNKIYPELPNKIKNLCTIIRCDDYGPITKLYGALISETDPETIIISVDDDCIYPPNLVSKLLYHHQTYPNSAICGTGALLGNGILFASIYTNVTNLKKYNSLIGFDVPDIGRNVDLIHGFVGVLYKRSFFPIKSKLYEDLFRYPMTNNAMFHNDDVTISGYLSMNGIKMRIFGDIPSVTSDVKNADALSYNIPLMVYRFDQSIKNAQAYGMFLTYEKTNYYESPVTKLFIMILFVVMGIMIVRYLQKN